jgi:hypothetical protein
MAQTAAEQVFAELHVLLARIKLLGTYDHLLRRTENGARAAYHIEAAKHHIQDAENNLASNTAELRTPMPDA